MDFQNHLKFQKIHQQLLSKCVEEDADSDIAVGDVGMDDVVVAGKKTKKVKRREAEGST